jgi:hypothetical protein
MPVVSPLHAPYRAHHQAWTASLTGLKKHLLHSGHLLRHAGVMPR